MAWRQHTEATSGQRAAPSAPDRLSSLTLERLESQAASSSLYAALASPTGRCAPGASQPAWPDHVSTRAFSCPARSFSARVGGAIGLQCPCLNDWSMHNHAVRGAGRLCHLAVSVHCVTPRSVVVGYPLLGKADFSEHIFMPSLPRFFSVSPIFCSFCFIRPYFSFLSCSHLPVLRGFRFLTLRLTLQLARFAIRGQVHVYVEGLELFQEPRALAHHLM